MNKAISLLGLTLTSVGAGLLAHNVGAAITFFGVGLLLYVYMQWLSSTIN